MDEFMAGLAEQDKVIEVSTKFADRKGCNVMGLESGSFLWLIGAPLAGCPVSLPEHPYSFLPFKRTIEGLTLGGDSTFPSRNFSPALAEHSIERARIAPFLVLADRNHITPWDSKLAKEI